MKRIRNAVCILCLLVTLISCQSAPNNAAVNTVISDDRYIAGDLNILVELGIATNEEISTGTYITNLEALQVIHRILGNDDIDTVDATDIMEWYRGDTFAPIDHIDDKLKKLLLDLSWFGISRNSILTDDDILNIKPDEDITNYEALIYVTRMIGDTYGCTDYQEELDFTKKEQTYEAALQKGIIDNIAVEESDLPIMRKDFFDIIHRATFVERSIGTITTMSGKYIDDIIENNERTLTPGKEVIVHTNKILAESTINEDMSLSWVLTDEYSFLQNDDYFTEVNSITDNGIITLHHTGAYFSEMIYPDDVIEIIVQAYPQKLDYIRCVYYKYDDDYQTKDKWYLDFDISNINLLITGEAPKPGVYTYFKKQWVPEKISLSEGNFFKENAYYLLTSYEHEYRKPEYNNASQAIFKATETSDIYYNSNRTGRLPFQGIVINTSDTHIQEIIIQGNAESGFTLYVTPESKEAFEEKEGSEPS